MSKTVYKKIDYDLSGLISDITIGDDLKSPGVRAAVGEAT